MKILLRIVAVMASIPLMAAIGPQAILSHKTSSSPWIGCATPLSAWAMTEGTGLTLNDSSGNSNTATFSGAGALTWQVNGTLYPPGMSSTKTPLLSGTGNAATSSTSLLNFSGATPFSVSLWIYNPAASGTLIGNLNTTGGAFPGWELQTASSVWVFALINNVSGNWIQVRSNVLVNLSTLLNYVHVTYDGSKSGSGVHIYEDGTDNGSTVFQNSLTGSTANGIAPVIGSRINGTVESTGALAFVEVYPCVNTPTQVAAMHTAGPGLH